MKQSNFSWGKSKKEDKDGDDDDEDSSKKSSEKESSKGKSEKDNVFAINSDVETFETDSDLEDGKSDESVKARMGDIITLKSIDLQIKKGEFVCIIGDVGAGKSSIINALLGELTYLDKETYDRVKDEEITDELLEEIIDLNKAKGVIQVDGSISLVQQIPWI